MTWRAVVFLPFVLASFLLLLLYGLALLGLPLLAGYWITLALHTHAAITFLTWLMLLWAFRRFKLWHFYADSPSDVSL